MATETDVFSTENVALDIQEPALEKCMFCLEDVPLNTNPRACLCVLQYHDSCYATWVQMYGTLCPLCRKTPIPIVNPDTLELEFELVTNGVDPGHTLPEHTFSYASANYTESVVATNRRLNTIVLMFFATCMIVLTMTLVIALRIFNAL